ncbi:hypothetical protein TNCT_546291 [Trichonephila clavata]|uniref:Uncharacterized protein n=1 Tax=Trichonephila clavata TaxID=2740835 RepID=A0A8X6ITD7_TRICU|nr:hypothetical protein TNCT_546291 [Trichonephila clavata]
MDIFCVVAYYRISERRPLNPRARDSPDSSRSVSQPVLPKVSQRAGSSELVSSELHHGTTFSNSLSVDFQRSLKIFLEKENQHLSTIAGKAGSVVNRIKLLRDWTKDGDLRC